jgi:preprotein translocase subunit SecG
MESLIIVIHILSAVAIVGLVLIQQGKGADMGASFGSGASQTIFGSAGTGNVLTKSTTWLAVLFFITSLSLAVVARNRADAGIEVESLLANPEAAAAAVLPATDVPVVAADASVEVSAEEVPAELAVELPAVAAEAESVAPAVEAVVEPNAQSTEN